MDCIKDFLDDSYQAKLRKFAQRNYVDKDGQLIGD